MPNEPLVIIFPQRKQLIAAIAYLREVNPALLAHAAIISKADVGEVVIFEDDLSVDEGALAGGTLGAAMTTLGLVQLGALTLPGVGAVVALGVGALMGGLVGSMTGRAAANLLDFGFANAQIERLAAQLQDNRPALALRLDDAAAEQAARAAVAGFDGEILAG